MPSPSNLMDVYTDELRDLWSANEQMQGIVNFAREAIDERLKHTLETAAARIAEHTAKLKSMVEAAGGGRQRTLPRHGRAGARGQGPCRRWRFR
jgi:ferritin-like metal-binding protein YciE